jgi:hypothetical protein
MNGTYDVEMDLFRIIELSVSLADVERKWVVHTWSTSWCARRPLFCKTLYSSAPVAIAIFFATGYLGSCENVLVMMDKIVRPVYQPPRYALARGVDI